MAQKTHDQAGPHAELPLGVDDGAVQAADHGGEGDAAGGVALRIEEHFDVAHIVGMRALQIGERQIVEILLGDQHRHALIIDVEKILQVAKPVGLAHRVDRFVFQPHAVAARQRQHQLRLQAAFDVNVQLALGQPFDQGVDLVHLLVPPARRQKPLLCGGVSRGLSNQPSAWEVVRSDLDAHDTNQ